MDFLFLVIEHHGSFIAGLFICIFDDSGCSLVSFTQDSLLHLFDPFFNTSDNHFRYDKLYQKNQSFSISIHQLYHMISTDLISFIYHQS